MKSIFILSFFFPSILIAQTVCGSYLIEGKVRDITGEYYFKNLLVLSYDSTFIKEYNRYSSKKLKKNNRYEYSIKETGKWYLIKDTLFLKITNNEKKQNRKETFLIKGNKIYYTTYISFKHKVKLRYAWKKQK